MKWAIDSGFALGCCQVAAQLADKVVEVLEPEIDLAVKATQRIPMNHVHKPHPELMSILQRARQASYAGQSITRYAGEIDQIWRRLSTELSRNPVDALRHAPALLAGYNLGGAYKRCALRFPHKTTAENLDGAQLWLLKLQRPDAGAPLPGFTVDVRSRIGALKQLLAGAAPAGLPTVADHIDAFRGEVTQQFAPP